MGGTTPCWDVSPLDVSSLARVNAAPVQQPCFLPASQTTVTESSSTHSWETPTRTTSTPTTST